MNFSAKFVFIPFQLSHSEKKHFKKSEKSEPILQSSDKRLQEKRGDVVTISEFAQSRYEPVVCCVLRLSKSADSHVDDNQNLIFFLFSFSLFITNCSLFL